MELTEFEKKLKFLCSAFQYVDSSSDDVINGVIQDYAKDLLDLARKELFKEQEHCVIIPEDDYYEQLASQYQNGREYALKDLPKWKKATEHKDLKKHIAILEENKVLLSNYLEEGDYYIVLDDLKTLPKEE